MKIFLSGIDFCLDEGMRKNIDTIIKDLVCKCKGEECEFVFEANDVSYFTKLCLSTIFNAKEKYPDSKIIFTKVICFGDNQSGFATAFSFNKKKFAFTADKIVFATTKNLNLEHYEESILYTPQAPLQWALRYCDTLICYTYPEIYTEVNICKRSFEKIKKKTIISLNTRKTAGRIRRCIEGLPEIEAHALHLKAEGKTNKEISEILQCPAGKVSTILGNASYSIILMLKK